MPSLTEVRFHPFQLTRVWASRVDGRRRQARHDEAREPAFSPYPVRRIVVSADGQGFRCEWTVSMRIGILEDEIFEARVASWMTPVTGKLA